MIILYITHSNEAEARRLGDQMVSRRLAACANYFPIGTSYRWGGVMETGQEWVSILKTTEEGWQVLEQAVEAEHPYEVPCIIRLEVRANEAYEAWIRENVSLP